MNGNGNSSGDPHSSGDPVVTWSAQDIQGLREQILSNAVVPFSPGGQAGDAFDVIITRGEQGHMQAVLLKGSGSMPTTMAIGAEGRTIILALKALLMIVIQVTGDRREIRIEGRRDVSPHGRTIRSPD